MDRLFNVKPVTWNCTNETRCWKLANSAFTSNLLANVSLTRNLPPTLCNEILCQHHSVQLVFWKQSFSGLSDACFLHRTSGFFASRGSTQCCAFAEEIQLNLILFCAVEHLSFHYGADGCDVYHCSYTFRDHCRWAFE